jgi:thioredoxin-dependent peroxiredoxin
MTSFMITTPEVTFKTRVRTEQSPGFTWKDVTSRDMFQGKRVAIFAIPGAYTPTCSSTHLPGYEAAYEDIRNAGINEVYCLSVNDSFVMNSWFESMAIENVKPIPDGSGEFSRKMGFLVDKDNLGFGMRSWRYSMVVTDGVVEMMWVEPGLKDNAENDPFIVSDAETMLKWLRENPLSKAA